MSPTLWFLCLTLLLCGAWRRSGAEVHALGSGTLEGSVLLTDDLFSRELTSLVTSIGSAYKEEFARFRHSQNLVRDYLQSKERTKRAPQSYRIPDSVRDRILELKKKLSNDPKALKFLQSLPQFQSEVNASAVPSASTTSAVTTSASTTSAVTTSAVTTRPSYSFLPPKHINKNFTSASIGFDNRKTNESRIVSPFTSRSLVYDSAFPYALRNKAANFVTSNSINVSPNATCDENCLGQTASLTNSKTSKIRRAYERSMTVSPESFDENWIFSDSLIGIEHLDELMSKLVSDDMEIQEVRTIGDYYHFERSRVTERIEDFWHSYTYNTGVYDRERSTVYSITHLPAASPVQHLSAVFSVPVRNSLLAQDMLERVVAVDSTGEVRPLRPGMGWTRTTLGCACPRGGGNDESCACCHPGGCLCSSYDICGPCPATPRESDAFLCSAEDARLSVNAVAPLTVRRNGTVLVAAMLGTFTVLHTDGTHITPLLPKEGLPTQLSSGVLITNVATATLPIQEERMITYRNYIVTFRATQEIQLVQEIVLDEHSKSYELRGLNLWYARGEEMKLLQTEERAFIFVLRNNTLTAMELKANTRQEIHVQQLGVLSFNDSIRQWHTFLNFDEPFVVVSNERKACFYTIIKEEVVEQKEIFAAKYNASRFDGVFPVESGNYRGDAAVMAVSGNMALVFTWQPQEESYSQSMTFSALPDEPWTPGAVLQSAHSTEVIGIDNRGRPLVLSVEFSTELLPDPLTVKTDDVRKAVAELQETINFHQRLTKAVTEKLKRSVEGASVITGTKVLTGGLRANEIHASNLMLNSVTVTSSRGVERTLDQHQARLADETRALEAAAARLDLSEQRLKDGIHKNALTADVSGHTMFVNMSVQRLKANNVHIYGRVLQDTISDLVNTSYLHDITGIKKFSNPLEVSSLYVTSLNDIPVTEFVTETGDYFFKKVSYQNDLTIKENLQLYQIATIGSADLSQAMLTAGNNELNVCHFSEVFAAEGLNVQDGKVNGVNIVELQKTVFTRDGSSMITGSLEFLTSLIINGNLMATSVNEVNVINLLTTAVLKDQNAIIESEVEFLGGVTVNGNVIVDGLLNNRSFPSEYPTKKQTLITLENKEFDKLTVGRAIVGGSVDGVRTEDIVTLTTDQIITGQKIFASGVEVESSLNINNHVIDGVNLRQIEEEAGKIKSDNVTFNVVFESAVSMSNMEVNGRINNLNFSEIIDDLLLINEPLSQINSKKSFIGDLTSTEMTLSTINNIALNQFIRSDSDRQITISGPKEFQNGFGATNMIVHGYVDGVNMTNLLLTSLYKNTLSQTVTGRKIFTGKFTGSLLNVSHELDNINFKNVATKSGRNIFSLPQRIEAASFMDLTTRDVYTLPSKTIDGFDLDVVSRSVVFLDSDQTLLHPLLCVGNVNFGSSLSAKYVNEYDLEQFVQNLAFTDTATDVLGNVIFNRLTVLGNADTIGKAGISGVNVSHLDTEAVQLDDEVLHLEATWEEIAFEDSLVVNGLLNGYNIEKLNNEALYLDDLSASVNIAGNKTFFGDVVIEGNLSSPLINGLSFKEDVLTKSTEQSIKAPYSFQTLHAEHLMVADVFNGMDIGHLIETRLGSDLIFNGPINFNKDVDIRELAVVGLVDHVNISHVFEDAITLGGEYNNITGGKIFARRPTFESLSVKMLNKEHFSDIVNTLVRSDMNNDFTGNVTVRKITADTLTTNALTLLGLVDGENMTQLLEDFIYLNRNEFIDNATFTFENLVIGKNNLPGDLLVGTLNSLDPFEDYLHHDVARTIRSNVTFSKLRTGNVSVTGTVNGWRLTAFDEALKVTGGQSVHGSFTCGQARVLGSVNLTGSLAPVASEAFLPAEVVPLNFRSLFVNGHLHFVRPVRSRDLWSFSDLINGVNVTALAKNAWRPAVPTSISGHYMFEGDVIFEDDLILGNHSLSTLLVMQSQMDAMTQAALLPTDALRKSYHVECTRGSDLLGVLDRGMIKPDRLLQVYRLLLEQFSSSVSTLIIQTETDTLMLLPQAPGACSVTVLRWEGVSLGFQPWHHINGVGRVGDWMVLSGLPWPIIAVAVNSSSKECDDKFSLTLNMTDGFFKTSQLLDGSDQVQWDRSNGLLRLRLGGGVAYDWSAEENQFVRVADSSTYDLVRWVPGPDGRVGWASLGRGLLTVGEDNQKVADVFVGLEDDDPDVEGADVGVELLYDGPDLMLFVTVRRQDFEVKNSMLYVVRPESSSDEPSLQDWIQLSAHSSGMHLCPAPHGYSHPLLVLFGADAELELYWLKGSGKLSKWHEGLLSLETPGNVSWVGHFTSDHGSYLALRSQDTLLVYQFEMIGQRVERELKSCSTVTL